MLDKDQIAAASKTLHDHWRAGTKCAGLEAVLRPHDRVEGYAIQARIEGYSSASLFGWKIAATSEAGQKHINVDGPMAGRILAETVIPDGGTASMAGNEMRVAEPEFAFGGFRQRRRRADHCRQRLRAFVRARPAGGFGLARPRSRRGKADHHI